MAATPKRFETIKNWLSDDRHIDTLHKHAAADTLCTRERCRGSVMNIVPQRPVGVPRTREETLKHAEEFIEQYYTSLKRAGSSAHQKRWSEVKDLIENTGTYDLTMEELTFGAKLAWRNAPRCVGRIQWSKLQVFDCRDIMTARGMFDAVCNHIKYGTNKGNLRSAITIFPKREEGRGDFRVWNATILRYAGYRRPDGTILGDGASLELTELCIKLGWKPKKTMFDILPLVLTAAGSDPEMFEIPEELILEVKLVHPDYPWFEEMGLKWYALPGVSSLLFDCGGLEFPACPFNGWYMGTEIGARDLTDPVRYNLLPVIGEKMGLDTLNVSSLWKDKALVEINYAVIYSFQKENVTITDHHTACDSFMKHMDKEHSLRGGCPADWVWIVPPMSGGLTQVFHQEMINYKLKPSYEYQDDLLKTFVWKKDRGTKKTSKGTSRKLNFRQFARAVKFTAKLMVKAMSSRVKCTILYASETGRSEDFGHTLREIFNHAFDAKVYCMDEYEPASLQHESLVLVVTSTFGNGEPPENGNRFAKELYNLSQSDHPSNINGEEPLTSLTSEIQTKSKVKGPKVCKLGEMAMGSSFTSSMEESGELSNVRYSVFALGSRAYPYFAAFGHFIDDMLDELGAERILDVGEGDELSGQEESFREWAKDVFQTACDVFCVGDSETIQDATTTLSKNKLLWTPDNFRITTVKGHDNSDLCSALSRVHNKTVLPCLLMSREQLQSKESDRQTILVKLHTQSASELVYEPGDHVGVYPTNDSDLVNGVLDRIVDAPPHDQIVCVQHLTEDTNISDAQWIRFERLPACTLPMILTHFLDLTTPSSQTLLRQLATLATDKTDKANLETLANDSSAYEDWRYDVAPNFLELLQQFPSVRVPASLLLTQLPLLQLRYYSISSCPRMHPGEIHATVAVLRYKTKGGQGPLHEGVCSGWLNKCPQGSVIPCVIRGAPGFHLPKDDNAPVLMVGPGTGIAPFRSFWQKRQIGMEMRNTPNDGEKVNEMIMYFGCRSSSLDNIYKDELGAMKAAGVLSDCQVAFSREPGHPKVYVQDLLRKHSSKIYNLLANKGGHFYVCGDVTMSHDVTNTLEAIVQKEGGMSHSDATRFIKTLRNSNRFHEDIFGVGIRKTGEHQGRTEEQINMAMRYLE